MNNLEGNQIMSDEIFEMKLEFFLRSTGQLFPTTPAQVEAFEKNNNTIPKKPTAINPLEILSKGIRTYRIPDETHQTNASEEWNRYAARNGKEIPEDIQQKMKQDRENNKK